MHALVNQYENQSEHPTPRLESLESCEHALDLLGLADQIVFLDNQVR